MSKGYICCEAPHKENWGEFCQYKLSLNFCVPKGQPRCPYLGYYPAPSIYKRFKRYWFLYVISKFEEIQYAIFHPHDNKIFQEYLRKPSPPSTVLTMTYEEWWNNLLPFFKEFYLSQPEGQKQLRWRRQQWDRLAEYKKWLKRKFPPLIELAKLWKFYGKEDCPWGGCENCSLDKHIKKVPLNDDGTIPKFPDDFTFCSCFDLIDRNLDEEEDAKKPS